MNYMFETYSKLISLDLSKFDTRKVLYMDKLFCNCSSLTSLNLNFNTTRVYHLFYMLGFRTSLKSLNISSFRTNKCNEFRGMFEKDTDLNLYITEKTYSNLIKSSKLY